MGTTARRFYPYTNNWDGTDPASGDVLKLDTAINATLLTAAQSCDFQTSGSKEITVDPNTTGRTATGVNSAFGWAINIAGSDGMDGTADARRFIPAGTWLFQGTIGSITASTNPCTVSFYVYRVAASPSTTRTLLFSSSVNAGLVGLNTDFSHTTASQSQIVLEAGETVQVTYTLTCTGQVGGLVIALQMGDSVTNNDLLVDLPSPGVRTYYEETITTSCVVTATVTDGTKTLTGVVRDSTGAPVDGATAKLFNQTSDTRISTDTVGADGVYQFTRADNDAETYYVVGYSSDSLHGTSDRGLTAT